MRSNNFTTAFVGDIAFNGLLSENPELNFERFEKVAPILQNSDMVFANLEVPLRGDNSKNDYKKFIHYALHDPSKTLWGKEKLRSLNYWTSLEKLLQLRLDLSFPPAIAMAMPVSPARHPDAVVCRHHGPDQPLDRFPVSPSPM